MVCWSTCASYGTWRTASPTRASWAGSSSASPPGSLSSGKRPWASTRIIPGIFLVLWQRLQFLHFHDPACTPELLPFFQGRVARLRPVPDLRGHVRRWHDLLLPQTGAHLLHQPSPGTTSDQLGQDGCGHCQVPRPLHFSALCLWLRNESTTLVSEYTCLPRYRLTGLL